MWSILVNTNFCVALSHEVLLARHVFEQLNICERRCLGLANITWRHIAQIVLCSFVAVQEIRSFPIDPIDVAV